MQGIVRLKSHALVSVALVAISLLCGGFGAFLLLHAQSGPTTAAAANKYADPAQCEACHADIASTFHKTGMGRSFYKLQPGTAVEDFTPGKPYYHEASNTYIAMIVRDGKYYQRRWQGASMALKSTSMRSLSITSSVPAIMAALTYT